MFLAPTHGSKTHSKTLAEKEYNNKIRTARNISEHSYSRLKNKFPRLKRFLLGHHRVKDTFYACLALVNIDSEFDNPMRYTVCKKKHCPYCDS